MLRHLLLAASFLLAVGVLPAQKYGHLNFGNLLATIPGTEAAEAELSAYNDELVEEGERMVAALRARVAEIEAMVEDLPPVELDKYRAEIEQGRREIAAYEQEVGQKLEARRRELLGPLVAEARAAVQTVARENGYELVFDTSQFNTVLFARESDDLMELVRKQLGL
ncbi:outer membrane protein [Lewinella marina]|uniref:OmpH family outer membrane protein n=1 Tax=Neolewinella marina TaxID=438751 RepID=A0A2G0CGC7_9BACT|nr:OmpH family outer membrane protein [Neolewinella marina]NJB86516.1 outer membrane protein [Neolewinella marina]PHK99029.1 hypothetical protein CGL56_06090 [Neolewinella marina]